MTARERACRAGHYTPRVVLGVLLGGLLAGCVDDQRALSRDLAAMQLMGRSYGEAYAALTNAGFECGPYLNDQGVTMQEVARSLDMTCHRHLERTFGCDLSQLVYVTGAPQTWRIENVSSWSGGACY